jgi:hypothetical protein
MPSPPLPWLLRFALQALRLLAPPNLRDRWLREWEGELTRWWQDQQSGQGKNGLLGLQGAGPILRLANLLGSAARDTRRVDRMPLSTAC